MKTRRFGSATIRMILLFPCLLLAACETDKPAPKPGNFVIVMIDRSLSFRSRQQEAMDRTVKYLDQIAGRKLGRWEGRADRISIISLDAIPAVLWEGDLQDLKRISKADWGKQFAARIDYQKCTDVTGAFDLAADRFASVDAESTRKYLLVFSDLTHEPPLKSASKCARPLREPSEDFPWTSLEDVSVNVFWLPINQKLIWQRAVKAKGLASHIALYSDSESGAVEIVAPPEAKRRVTESQRSQEAGRIRSILSKVLLFLLAVALIAAFGILVMMLLARRKNAPAIPVLRSSRSVLTPDQLRARNGAPPASRG